MLHSKSISMFLPPHIVDLILNVHEKTKQVFLSTAFWGILKSSNTKRLQKMIPFLSRRFYLLPQRLPITVSTFPRHRDQHSPANTVQHKLQLHLHLPLTTVFLSAFASRKIREKRMAFSLLACPTALRSGNGGQQLRDELVRLVAAWLVNLAVFLLVDWLQSYCLA